MVIITYLKPNIVIQSDILLSGSINVIDDKKHLLLTKKISNQSFVSIRVKPEWPKEIEVDLRSGQTRVNKELNI